MPKTLIVLALVAMVPLSVLLHINDKVQWEHDSFKKDLANINFFI